MERSSKIITIFDIVDVDIQRMSITIEDAAKRFFLGEADHCCHCKVGIHDSIDLRLSSCIGY